jgi:TRAP-type C4-dicarboxylate transport system permease small subunit
MSKKQIKDKRAEKKADRMVKLLILALVALALILMIWFSFANA